MAFRLDLGTIMLVEGGARRAVVLGVASLAEFRIALGDLLLPPDDSGVAWIDPTATPDLAIGLRHVA